MQRFALAGNGINGHFLVDINDIDMITGARLIANFFEDRLEFFFIGYQGGQICCYSPRGRCAIITAMAKIRMVFNCFILGFLPGIDSKFP